MEPPHQLVFFKMFSFWFSVIVVVLSERGRGEQMQVSPPLSLSQSLEIRFGLVWLWMILVDFEHRVWKKPVSSWQMALALANQG